MSPVTPFSAARNRGEASVAAIRPAANDPRTIWTKAFRTVRAEMERRASPLGPEDQAVQSMPDASPTKWHRAHTTWFFEQFLLLPHLPGYQVFDAEFAYLFNSYYVAAGPRHARPRRGMLTRPELGRVASYRSYADKGAEPLINGGAGASFPEVLRILEIGLHHEQQHQELLLTDILHAFAQNPTDPAYDSNWQMPSAAGGLRGFVPVPSGIHAIGHEGETFCFDNELPKHNLLIPEI